MASPRRESEAVREERGWSCLGTAKDSASFCLIPHQYAYPGGVNEDAGWVTCSAVLRIGDHSARIRHEPMLADGELMQLAQLCQLPSSILAGYWWEPMEPYLAVRRSKAGEGPFLEVFVEEGFGDLPPGLEAHVKSLETTFRVHDRDDERSGVFAAIPCSEEDLARFGSCLQARLETLRR